MLLPAHDLLSPAAHTTACSGLPDHLQLEFWRSRFGNQNNSTQKHSSYIYSGSRIYTINFTTTDMFGRQATDYQSVQVHALPVSAFSYYPVSRDSLLSSPRHP
ncbi:MAG: hypothetical protein IPH45_21725 [Bacteroidales bacterium]|nr:hypothetical protein [Bacteroidales bacterium]